MARRVGFIGLGDVGKPMAEKLVAGGLEATVFAPRGHADQGPRGEGRR